jgi:hypothetical protein
MGLHVRARNSLNGLARDLLARRPGRDSRSGSGTCDARVAPLPKGAATQGQNATIVAATIPILLQPFLLS